MRIIAIVAVSFFSTLVFSGCSTPSGAERREESNVDIQISKQAPRLPSSVSPGQPQEGFKQDPKGTKNS